MSSNYKKTEELIRGEVAEPGLMHLTRNQT